ncbi:MAG TPA: T9SS type A sorting domain-containing protein [Adhaeribacter sp.]|nr:T9SS type A sorting domain-containing protein [Adhaeribacter sp.]
MKKDLLLNLPFIEQTGRAKPEGAPCRLFPRSTRFLLTLLMLLAVSGFQQVLAQVVPPPQFFVTGGTGSNSFPFNTTSTKRTQFIYLPGDLPNALPGNINRIYFKSSTTGNAGSFADFRLRMGQTSATTFPGAGGLDFFTNLTTIISAPVYNIPAPGTDSWVPIDLPIHFPIDPLQTLIIEVEMSTKISGGFTLRTSTIPGAPNHKRLTATTLTATSGGASGIFHDFGIDVLPSTPNDVAVSDITGVASGCGLTSSQAITITVRNMGSASQSNIPVSYRVNGTTMDNGLIPGPLSQMATATHTFTTTANLSAPGLYVIDGIVSQTGDSNSGNDTLSTNVTNSLIPTLPISLDFETAATGSGAMQVITNSNSAITDGAGGARTGTKGMIMDGINSASWITPVGVIDPWTNNLDHFSAVYMCIDPSSAPPLDSLFLLFDLKQLFKTTNANTNFRVTVNGQQIGDTYRPPFDPSNPATPITWQRIRVDLTAYKHLSNVEIGLESSVKEEFANATGPANLIDNLILSRRVTGLKDNVLQSQISVYPNPSAGIFNVTAPNGKYTIEVADLTGRTILKQNANGTSARLNLSEAAKGIYLMKITSEGSIATKRLVVE